MAKVDPVKSSIQTTDTVNGLEITIPAKLRIGVVLLMTFWLCLWAVGLVTAVMHLLSGRADVGVILFMVVWLAIWIVGGAITMAGVAWMIIGREIVRANVAELQHVRQIGLFSISREYEMAKIMRLRVQENPFAYADGRFALSGPFSRGTVTFDYGASTKRFGIGLDEAEAHMVIETLTKRFRNLAA